MERERKQTEVRGEEGRWKERWKQQTKRRGEKRGGGISEIERRWGKGGGKGRETRNIGLHRNGICMYSRSERRRSYLDLMPREMREQGHKMEGLGNTTKRGIREREGKEEGRRERHMEGRRHKITRDKR